MGSQGEAVTGPHGLEHVGHEAQDKGTDRFARSGDGYTRDSRCPVTRMLPLMQKLGTKLTEKHTHTYIHTERWIPLDRQKNPGIGAALVACLSRGPELSIQVLDRGRREGSVIFSVQEGNGSGRPGSLQPLGPKLRQDALLGLATTGSKRFLILARS